MAGDSKKVQPIIIKRIKKGGHAAHGGAWKIAYADFVTAMMAFFLLMWLLGSTTEGDRKGIADYFNSPLKVAFFGGSGAGDATSILKGGGNNLAESTGQMKKGATPESIQERARKRAIRAEQAAAEAERLKVLKNRVEEVIANDPRLAQYKSQIQLDMTAEGLRIQIVDDQNRPMFDSGNAEVKGYMYEILQAIGAVLSVVPNHLTIEGHTDAKPFIGGERGYSNWELSADRANASRRVLITGGLQPDKVLRVQGLASSVPYERNEPMSPLNRRISIIVMNRQAEDRMFNVTEVEDEEPLPAEGQAPPAPVTSLPSPIKPLSPPSDRR